MSSGMIAPASVPHVMMTESFHQIDGSTMPAPSGTAAPAANPGMRRLETANVKAIDTNEVIHTSVVRGVSKFILSTFWKRLFAMTSLMKYEMTLAMTMTTRITKI